VIYARVSSSKQKDDLNRQIQILKEYSLKNGHKIDHVFEDIGSGMSSDRTGLNQLLTMVFKKEIHTIYVSFKDRISRFGFNYFENICSKFGTKIEILDDDNFRNKDMEKELTDDLIAIIHYYSMKVYNGRRKKFNKIKKELAENDIE
jgi:predicted site-specific integrase-resolvase